VQLARAEVTQTAMEPVDLCDVAVEAIDELWPQCRQRHIEIRQEGCDGPMMALGDRGVLARALVNLIGNAVKYGPDGSTSSGARRHGAGRRPHLCRPVAFRSPTRGRA
jgi:signal transduction histidine kinase